MLREPVRAAGVPPTRPPTPVRPGADSLDLLLVEIPEFDASGDRPS